MTSAATTEGLSEPLGASLRDGGVNFAVWSARATMIEVCIFDGDAETRYALPGKTGDVFHGFIPGLAAGTRYGLRAHGTFAPHLGLRFDADKLLLDPYALEIDRPFQLDDAMFSGHGDSAAAMPKAVVCAPEPARVEVAVPWGETVVYELHVKGFTKEMPAVPEALRGTFAGLASPAAIGHLKALGVTTVELLPCMAWIDEAHLKRKGLTNYWGYNPIAWLAPDPRLAPGGWAEVRAAVEALANAGIETILDVVYNHSGEGDEFGPTVSLRGLDNGSYYRLAEDAALYVNDAGTGDVLNADHPVVVRLVVDSLRTWRRLGGFAGFRFDLATTLGRRRDGFDIHAPLLEAISQDAELSGLKLIAEPWDCGPGGYRLGQFPNGWGEWNDRYRDTVRRFWRGDGVSLGELATRLSGSQDVFGGRPGTTSVNFVTAHDGFTLRDLVSFDHKHNEANGEDNRDGTHDNHSWVSGDPGRDQRNLLATLLVSRSTPMLAMGSETGQGQGGNNNAYAQDNATSWLDWAGQDKALTDFCARLIAARREHPALRGGFLTGELGDGDWPDVVWTRADGQALEAEQWDAGDGATLVAAFCQGNDRVCVVFHRSGDDIPIALPPVDDGRAWSVLIDTADDARQGVIDSLTVKARSVVILAEVASSRKVSSVSDGVLDALSEVAGIEGHWWSIDGVRHDVPRESKLAILKALGLEAGSDRSARDAIRALAEDFDRRPLPFARVHHGDGAVVLPVAAPGWLSVTGEDGNLTRMYTGEASRRVRGRDGRFADMHDADLGVLAPGRYRIARDDGDETCLLTVAPAQAWQPHWPGQVFGITAQLYAARRDGDSGIGDFSTLSELMARAGEAGAALVGINPLHALFPRNRDRASPYYPSDRRFLDPIYLDTGEAHDDGPVIDYPAVWARKEKALRARFEAEKDDPDFAAFVTEGGEALQAFARFQAGVGTGDALFASYLQWLCDRQLTDAVRDKVGLYRDLAIGAAPDGAEAMLIRGIARGVSLGAPPDPFSADGQVWGIPPYSPFGLARDGYADIAAIYRANMRHAQALRIDHAIGLMRQFWVPDGAPGSAGAYVRFPCADLLGQLKLESVRAQCVIIGEDLGTVPEGFRERMHEAGVLSYKVMPFEREGIGFRPPESYPADSLACVATHDLPPLKGWWQGEDIAERRALGLDVADDAEAVRAQERAELIAALKGAGVLDDGDADGPLTEAIAAAVHAFVAKTPSRIAMVQLEDLAGMAIPVNLPGTDRERPNWRHRVSQTLEAVFASDWAQSLLASIQENRKL